MAVDPAFGTNDFNEPKLYSESETLVKNILTVLFGVPGSYPTMPKLGMNIQALIMSLEDDIDPSTIKSELVSQCSHFREVVSNGEFDVIKTTYMSNDKLEPILLISVPTVIRNTYRNLVIGITSQHELIKYNFSWID